MKIHKEKITFKSAAQIEFIDITDDVQKVIDIVAFVMVVFVFFYSIPQWA